jgi:uncharacterized protein (DUF1501 family)
MKAGRRQTLQKLAGIGGLSLAGGLGVFGLGPKSANASDYKALVIIHLNGGNDGNDLLVPIDGAFSDYSKSRPSIAVGQSNLMPFSSNVLDHRLGLNSACSSLMPLYDQGRLAFVVNTGPLVKPTTVSDVLNNRASLPPFLFSHPEQMQYVQGWMGDEDPSGWGGRAIEAMPANVNPKANLVTVGHSRTDTLVMGRRSRIVSIDRNAHAGLGRANLRDSNNAYTQLMESISRLQSRNPLEAEYSRTFKGLFSDNVELAKLDDYVGEPRANFENNEIAESLRTASRIIPFYKSLGANRQVFLVDWGQFDTHAGQRNGDNIGTRDQDTQLNQLAKALVSFQTAADAANFGNEVIVLVMSEFGRTLDPAAGVGSDHAWGNHWIVKGNPVRGGQFYGATFPRLILGGPDDSDEGKRGYFIPQIPSDAVAADLVTWLGLPPSELTKVFPNLANFTTRSVGLV